MRPHMPPEYARVTSLHGFVFLRDMVLYGRLLGRPAVPHAIVFPVPDRRRFSRGHAATAGRTAALCREFSHRMLLLAGPGRRAVRGLPDADRSHRRTPGPAGAGMELAGCRTGRGRHLAAAGRQLRHIPFLHIDSRCLELGYVPVVVETVLQIDI